MDAGKIAMLKLCDLGLTDYLLTQTAMHEFTDSRDASTGDEVWFVQHHPVITLGRNQSRANILFDSGIPVIQSDRGGDVTYHGPGQIIMYCLFDLKRLKLGIKQVVTGLEEIIIRYLSQSAINATRLDNAPGVYVDNKKIASLGLRVRRGCTFHGIAFNVDMDLQPFNTIHPCGLKDMQVTQLADLGIETSCEDLMPILYQLIIEQFYSDLNYE